MEKTGGGEGGGAGGFLLGEGGEAGEAGGAGSRQGGAAVLPVGQVVEGCLWVIPRGKFVTGRAELSSCQLEHGFATGS